MELFWLLSPANKAKLMQFQYDEYGDHLNIPNEPKQEPLEIDTDMEDSELARFMSEAPSHQRKVE